MPELWYQFSHDLHNIVDMAQSRMTELGQATAVLSMMPLTTINHGTCPYVTGHPVHLVADVRVVMTYHMVVNHETTWW
jgi:hypothetical protein